MKILKPLLIIIGIVVLAKYFLRVGGNPRNQPLRNSIADAKENIVTNSTKNSGEPVAQKKEVGFPPPERFVLPKNEYFKTIYGTTLGGAI